MIKLILMLGLSEYEKQFHWNEIHQVETVFCKNPAYSAAPIFECNKEKKSWKQQRYLWISDSANKMVLIDLFWTKNSVKECSS